MAGQGDQKEIPLGCFPYFAGYFGPPESLKSGTGALFTDKKCKQITGASVPNGSRDTAPSSAADGSTFTGNSVDGDETLRDPDYSDGDWSLIPNFMPSYNVLSFARTGLEQMQKFPQLMTDAALEFKTVLSREDAVDPGQGNRLGENIKGNLKNVFDQASQGIEGYVASLKRFGIQVRTHTSLQNSEPALSAEENEQLRDKDDETLQEHHENMDEKKYDLTLMAAPDELSTVDGREKTFQNSSIHPQTFRPLAEAGFYCIGGTSVKCFGCGVKHQWESRHIDPANSCLHKEGCGMWMCADNPPKGRGRAIERLVFGCQHNRARSLSTPNEVPRPGRPSRVVQGAVGNDPQPRPRAQSEHREHAETTDEGRRCVNCGQNPNEVSDKVKLTRSVRVDKACDYCDGLVDSPEVCIRSTRHVCQREECQKQAEMSEDLEESEGG